MDDYGSIDANDDWYAQAREGVVYSPTVEVYNEPDPRSVLELLVKTGIIHWIAITSYIHLRHVQIVPQSKPLVRLSRLILFAFMPTLVWAEVGINLCRTILPLFLKFDINDLNDIDFTEANLEVYSKHWTRYLCGVAGMYVAQAPPDNDAEQSHNLVDADANAEAADEEAAPTKQAVLKLRLSEVHNALDVRQHYQSWSSATVLQVLVLILPILQGIGTIVLYARRYAHLSFDKRNLVAGIASIVCSASTMVILLCRSKWSSQLSSSATATARYPLGTLMAEILLAAVLNEAPWWYDRYWILPISWVIDFMHAGVLGVLLTLGILAAVWIFVWFFDDRIRQKVKINWQLVVGIPVFILFVWTIVDLISYVVLDIATLVAGPDSRHDYHWERDSWAKYLPIC